MHTHNWPRKRVPKILECIYRCRYTYMYIYIYIYTSPKSWKGWSLTFHSLGVLGDPTSQSCQEGVVGVRLQTEMWKIIYVGIVASPQTECRKIVFLQRSALSIHTYIRTYPICFMNINSRKQWRKSKNAWGSAWRFFKIVFVVCFLARVYIRFFVLLVSFRFRVVCFCVVMMHVAWY